MLDTFLSDARLTAADLLEIRSWFDQMSGGTNASFRVFSCDPVHDHSIHQPVTTAPAADPDLVGIWQEYGAALANGQDCLNWLVVACSGGEAVISRNDYTAQRSLADRALGQAEHVVTALEAMQ